MAWNLFMRCPIESVLVIDSSSIATHSKPSASFLAKICFAAFLSADEKLLTGDFPRQEDMLCFENTWCERKKALKGLLRYFCGFQVD